MARKVQKEPITRFEVQAGDLRVCDCGALFAWVRTGEKWRPCMTYVQPGGRFIANTEHPHPPRVCEARAAAAALDPEAPASSTPSPDSEWNMSEWRAWARSATARI